MDWRARGLWWLLRGFGLLPLAMLRVMGTLLGLLWWRSNSRGPRVVRTNLALCLPELSAAERGQLARDSLIETARSATELAWVWSRTLPTVLGKLRVDGSAELFLQARREGRALIVAAPHLGAWEVLNLWLSAQGPIGILYRPPRQRWLEGLLNRARSKSGAEPVPAEARGVRRLIEILRNGGVLGILPDQQPKQGDGEFVDFFGHPALTMSLLPKLAQRESALVLFAWVERLPGGQGWALHFRPADPPIDGPAALNANVEACARQALAQYQWTYKRFSLAPPGVANRYQSLRSPR
ncbi:MAG: lipid A biosynthesis lauroyl acyltransferase [Xanthomonadales bacterium]|nr:lipid A biosynthesis lauroyl acyltransferase [Xanthomonadales bacterium]